MTLGIIAHRGYSTNAFVQSMISALEIQGVEVDFSTSGTDEIIEGLQYIDVDPDGTCGCSDLDDDRKDYDPIEQTRRHAVHYPSQVTGMLRVKNNKCRTRMQSMGWRY